MNYRLLSKLLGIIALLIGGTMVFSLPWAHPALGYRHGLDPPQVFETRGFVALSVSIFICLAVGGLLMWFGRHSRGKLFRKEAMAVVGLSWVMATILGALPFALAGVCRDPDGNVPMSVVDALFESQSGFSTTGATVISELESPELVPHCILFWRSSTHFLGGLGIIVLFVVLLGQGSVGKAMMRAEMPGPTKEGATARMQHTAWLFAAIYCVLNLVLAIILWLLGLSVFDALCHAFGTMATGGFSTYNKSVGQFDSAAIDYTICVFMVLAGSNFTLLYFVCIGKPMRLLADVEWRTYMAVIGVVSALVVLFCYPNFPGDSWAARVADATRFGLFQVVSIVTTTGYGTHNFDSWNNFGRAALFLLMFVGGCAGSTAGGLKVIRHILFSKILRLEIEQAYHPSVVRPLRLGGQAVEAPGLQRSILVYFALILVIFVYSWMFVVTFEPDATWGDPRRENAESRLEHKVIDSATGVAATLNNIGPGLGIIGPEENYGKFSWYTKLLFTWLMMLGRLELFSILVLVSPAFWKSR